MSIALQSYGQPVAMQPVQRELAHDAARPSRLRLTARGRRALAALVAVPVLAGLSVVAVQASAAFAASSSASAAFDTVTVQPGDSLWNLAIGIAPDSDPRDVVAEISSLNGITGSIQPGQELAIPLQYSE